MKYENNGVHFAYPTRKAAPVLRGVSFEVGERTETEINYKHLHLHPAFTFLHLCYSMHLHSCKSIAPLNKIVAKMCKKPQKNHFFVEIVTFFIVSGTA